MRKSHGITTAIGMRAIAKIHGAACVDTAGRSTGSMTASQRVSRAIDMTKPTPRFTKMSKN